MPDHGVRAAVRPARLGTVSRLPHRMVSGRNTPDPVVTVPLL
ncbi:hypothetical protein [Streptomyces noursei]|nr:hypothetical protein [Streptomyces noursei]